MLLLETLATYAVVVGEKNGFRDAPALSSIDDKLALGLPKVAILTVVFPLPKALDAVMVYVVAGVIIVGVPDIAPVAGLSINPDGKFGLTVYPREPTFLILLLYWSATNTFPKASTATPKGLLKLAVIPVPSIEPEVPLPAKVVTTPSAVILRILGLPTSDTYILFNASIVMPWGKLKLAKISTESFDPCKPLPAKVVTTPLGVILRILWLPISATYTLPKASTASPLGLLKLAATPVPFVEPLTPLPAKVVTIPVGVILRILLLYWSTTNTLPEASTATPEGPLKLAAIPVASVEPCKPLPAKVETTPAVVILRILLLPKSATYTLPKASTAIPNGLLKLAAVPAPFVEPCTPLPAKVVIMPVVVILRIFWLPTSAT